MASQTQLLQNELSSCHEQIAEKDRQIQNLLTNLSDKETVLRRIHFSQHHTQNMVTEQMRLNHNLNIFVSSIKDGLETLNKSKPTLRIQVL